MLDHLSRRIAETLVGATDVTLATCGPAYIQAGFVPCAAQGMRLYVLVPRTSDHLFNIENQPAVVAATRLWELRGLAQVIDVAEAPDDLWLLHVPQAKWSSLVQISPTRLQIYAGHDAAESIDVDAELPVSERRAQMTTGVVMNEIASHYQALMERFVCWAAGDDDIRAVVQVGSRTRTDHPADEWSDVDLIIVADSPDRHLADTTRFLQIAPLWLSVLSRTAGNDPERLALFEGGYAMDFVYLPTELLRRAADAGIVPDVFQRGCRVLLDKDQLAARLVPKHFEAPKRTLPNQEEFAAACETFWYIAVYVAKQIRRGDPWLVKVRDMNLKDILLRMIEWHALSHAATDVWHMGRFMESWADPRALRDVSATFGRYDLADSRAALLRAAALFEWLARETAGRGGFDYQAGRYATVRGYVEQLLSGG